MPTQKRNQGDTGSVQEVGSLALGAQVASTAQEIAGPSMVRGGTLLSVRGAMSIHDITAGDGPWLVGVMDTDITTAELEAYLEQGGPTGPHDQGGAEIASRGRKIRTLGLILPSGDGTVAGMYLDDHALKGLRFTEADEAGGWSWWLYNRGRTMTTGATWRLSLSSFVRWNRAG